MAKRIEDYKFPVYGTQGGGLAKRVGNVHIFIEKPDCPGLDIGDNVPEEWGLCLANPRWENIWRIYDEE